MVRVLLSVVKSRVRLGPVGLMINGHPEGLRWLNLIEDILNQLSNDLFAPTLNLCPIYTYILFLHFK